MQSTDHYTWQGNVFHEAESESDAPPLFPDRSGRAVIVTVSDIDLPAIISDGRLYVQTPFPFLLEAALAGLPISVRDLETGVSIEGGGTLPPNRKRRAVHRKGLAKSGLVRRGGKR